MPSSSNRRRIEIPAGLYERLRERAEERGIPVAALVTWLLTETLDEQGRPQLHPTADQRLDEVLAIVRKMQADQQAQAAREYVRLRIPEGYVPLMVPSESERLSRHHERLIVELRQEAEGET
ncbi:MAG: hypothetical protein M9890_04280 [Thermomicrobiales bacterium]|nr:hypothetical protein [Thermomicrobiales bacterium]